MSGPFKMKGFSGFGNSPVKDSRVYKGSGHGYSKKDVNRHNRQKATASHHGDPHGEWSGDDTSAKTGSRKAEIKIIKPGGVVVSGYEVMKKAEA